MAQNFNNLSTVRFQQKLKPAALNIYRRIFPGCELQDLREKGVKVHILDKELGIDSLLYLPSGQWISIQEKYRENEYLKYLDFTQEYMNAAGTPYEKPGEWFKLGAQLYFYGWANKEGSGFEKWVILDIAKYKILVEEAGGLSCLGQYKENARHGKASFYAIPILKLKPAFVTDYRMAQTNKEGAPQQLTKEAGGTNGFITFRQLAEGYRTIRSR
ncbi:MAG: hypothetical protein DDT31_01726 [Syntrophomonadaceae bacterium]|nr:hypothetical protein [Bacillota bacterium]